LVALSVYGHVMSVIRDEGIVRCTGVPCVTICEGG
jgi:hypothetical protein